MAFSGNTGEKIPAREKFIPVKFNEEFLMGAEIWPPCL